MVLKSGSNVPSWQPEFAQVEEKYYYVNAAKDVGSVK